MFAYIYTGLGYGRGHTLSPAHGYGRHTHYTYQPGLLGLLPHAIVSSGDASPPRPSCIDTCDTKLLKKPPIKTSFKAQALVVGLLSSFLFPVYSLTPCVLSPCTSPVADCPQRSQSNRAARSVKPPLHSTAYLYYVPSISTSHPTSAHSLLSHSHGKPDARRNLFTV